MVKVRERQELTERDVELLPKLSAVGVIKGNKEEVLLSEEYTRLVEMLEGKDINKISDFVAKHGPVKMGEILQLFSHRLTRRQVNNMVFKLVDDKVLEPTGEGKARTYKMKE